MNDLETKTEEAKKVTTSEKVATNGKSVAPVEKPKKDELQEKKLKLDKILTPVSAEQRIKNAEHFQKVAEKHKYLKEKSDELNAFLIGRDGLKEKIKISNDNGQVIEISNSIVIGKVLNLCADELAILTDESEEQILNFAI